MYASGYSLPFHSAPGHTFHVISIMPQPKLEVNGLTSSHEDVVEVEYVVLPFSYLCDTEIHIAARTPDLSAQARAAFPTPIRWNEITIRFPSQNCTNPK